MQGTPSPPAFAISGIANPDLDTNGEENNKDRRQFQVQPQVMRPDMTSGHVGTGTEALPAGEAKDTRDTEKAWTRKAGGSTWAGTSKTEVM